MLLGLQLPTTPCPKTIWLQNDYYKKPLCPYDDVTITVDCHGTFEHHILFKACGECRCSLIMVLIHFVGNIIPRIRPQNAQGYIFILFQAILLSKLCLTLVELKFNTTGEHENSDYPQIVIGTCERQ